MGFFEDLRNKAGLVGTSTATNTTGNLTGVGLGVSGLNVQPTPTWTGSYGVMPQTAAPKIAGNVNLPQQNVTTSDVNAVSQKITSPTPAVQQPVAQPAAQPNVPAATPQSASKDFNRRNEAGSGWVFDNSTGLWKNDITGVSGTYGQLTGTEPKNVNVMSSTQADASIADNVANLDDEIKRRQAEYDLMSKQAEQRISQAYGEKQKQLGEQQAEQAATSKALQFRLGREATPYAQAEAEKLQAAQLRQQQELMNEEQDLLAKTKAAYMEGKYGVANKLYEEVKLKEEARKAQMENYNKAMGIEDVDTQYKKLQVKKMQQELAQNNIDSYASSFLDIDEKGNVTMPSSEDLQTFADSLGVPISQVIGSVRNKAYELSKLSAEDRKRELEIDKAAQSLLPEIVSEYEAMKKKGYTTASSPLEYLKQKTQATQAEPASKKEWEAAGGLAGTGKTYAQYIAGSTGMDTKKQSIFMTISNKYEADSLINAGIKGSTAIEIANQVISNPSSAGNQLKILYTLVKNLDPDSAVREGELSLASQTQSYFDKYKTNLDRVSQGKLLSETATKELAQATKDLAENWYATAQKREKQYQSKANVAGVKSEFNDYLSGFDRPWAETEKQSYSNFSDFTQKSSLQEKLEFNILRQEFPDKTPQDIFDLYKELNLNSEQQTSLKGKVSVEYPTGATGGQCGVFAHKIVDFPPVGDTVQEKKNAVDRFGLPQDVWSSNPKVGDVLIFENVGKYGHVAVVNEVLPDGQVRLTESNWNQAQLGREKVQHNRLVSINNPNIYGAIRGNLKV